MGRFCNRQCYTKYRGSHLKYGFNIKKVPYRLWPRERQLMHRAYVYKWNANHIDVVRVIRKRAADKYREKIKKMKRSLLLS